MRLGKTMSAEEIQVIGRFEGLRKILLGPAYAEHLDKPLCYWALPTDRRLPLAFLGRTLRDLLGVPFAELAATPGIGRKKIASLVQLLARAANTDPAELPAVILDPPPAAESLADGGDGEAGRLDSGQYLRGDLGAVAGERRPPRPERRDPRPVCPQPAEHDAGNLEHPAGRVHQLPLWPRFGP